MPDPCRDGCPPKETRSPEPRFTGQPAPADLKYGDALQRKAARRPPRDRPAGDARPRPGARFPEVRRSGSSRPSGGRRARRGTASGTSAHLPWCSIDNDDSRDLDQLTVAEPLPRAEPRGPRRRRRRGRRREERVADRPPRAAEHDVGLHRGRRLPDAPGEALVRPDVAERGEERLAVVTEYVVDGDGGLGASAIYRARVVNKAKLAYNAVAAWLSGEGPAPAPLAEVARAGREPPAPGRGRRAAEGAAARGGSARLRDARAAGRLRRTNDLTELKLDAKNRARDLIEDFMIAANGVTARFLRAKDDGVAPARRPLAGALAADRRAGRRATATPCPPSPTRRRSRSSSREGGRPTRSASRTSRSSS